MKKMLFGVMLFLSGIIGMLVFIILSIVYPWDYNGTTGILGFLLGTETIWIFVSFCIMTIGGFVICLYEAYIGE